MVEHLFEVEAKSTKACPAYLQTSFLEAGLSCGLPPKWLGDSWLPPRLLEQLQLNSALPSRFSMCPFRITC